MLILFSFYTQGSGYDKIYGLLHNPSVRPSLKVTYETCLSRGTGLDKALTNMMFILIINAGHYCFVLMAKYQIGSVLHYVLNKKHHY